MPSLNRIILMGNLTRDPEVRFMNSGTAVGQFGIAVNTKYGEEKEEALFIEVAVFGRQAEACGEYLVKGRPVLVEGRLRLERWTTDSGDKRQTYKVVASMVQFLGEWGTNKGEKKPGNSKQEEPELDFDDLPF